MEQKFAGESASVRAGMLAVDTEFAVCDSGSVFINSAFGVPPTISQIAGLPIWPLATPGARLEAGRGPWLVRAGVYGGNAGDEVITNRRGTRFHLNSETGALFIAESAWQANHDNDATGLRAAYKVGGYYDTGEFADLRADRVKHKGNWGIYGIADQQVFRERSSKNNQGLSLFARASAVPDDRNEAAWYLEGGAVYKGLLENRDEDVLGIGLSYTKISREIPPVSAGPTRHETILEWTYHAVVNEHLCIQPDFQLIFNPGAVSEADTAIVAGVRFIAEY